MASEEYLYSIYHCVHGYERYEIYRWKLSGYSAQPDWRCLRLPTAGESPCITAYASIGSKIYLIGFGGCSSRIMAVETRNFHSSNPAQIFKAIPSVLRANVGYRNAVAIGGKIYAFPEHFGPARERPLAESRFEVFDPETQTSKPLPEPPVGFPPFDSDETYAALKSRILLCVKRGAQRWLLAFDTAREDGGWVDLTGDYAANSLRNPFRDVDWRGIKNPSLDFDPDPLPFTATRLDKQCATALGCDDDAGSRLFATAESGRSPSCFAIVKFEDDPIRISKWYEIDGIPRSLAGFSCFSHGGNVFFTFACDDRPDSGIVDWEYMKFALDYLPDKGLYAARRVFYFRHQLPMMDSLRASFVIPASI